jgi:DNA-directed RNA polymerase subunit beta
MLTIKSDDVVGRAKAFEAIVKGIDIPASNVPESFKVLVKELQALSLNVVPTGVVTAKPQLTIADEKAEDTALKEGEALAEAAGEALVADKQMKEEEPLEE